MSHGNFQHLELHLCLHLLYIFLTKHGVKPEFILDRKFLKESFHFSAGNYISGLFMTGPALLMPVLILNILGAEEAAYYYIAFAVVALLLKIPSSVSLSLFVEGSHGEELKKNVEKSLSYAFGILIPAAVLLYIFSEQALGLMGPIYAAEGSGLLRLMIVASLFTGVNSIYFAIKRIQKEIKELVIVSGIIGLTVLVSSYLFLNLLGLEGAGYGWIAGNMVGCVVVLFIAIRKNEIWFLIIILVSLEILLLKLKDTFYE
ncbi:MAG: oligosaccharide flippase family protein [Methanolobus sp.]